VGCYFNVMDEGWMVGWLWRRPGAPRDELGGKLQCKHNVYLYIYVARGHGTSRVRRCTALGGADDLELRLEIRVWKILITLPNYIILRRGLNKK